MKGISAEEARESMYENGEIVNSEILALTEQVNELVDIVNQAWKKDSINESGSDEVNVKLFLYCIDFFIDAYDYKNIK